MQLLHVSETSGITNFGHSDGPVLCRSRSLLPTDCGSGCLASNPISGSSRQSLLTGSHSRFGPPGAEQCFRREGRAAGRQRCVRPGPLVRTLTSAWTTEGLVRSCPSRTSPSATIWSSRSGRPMAPAYESDSATSILWSRGESSRMRCGPRIHVADLLDPRFEPIRAWRDAPSAEGRARINTQAASTGRNRCSSAARGSAPTTRSISCPSRITTSNGIDCAPNLVASPGFASTSTFTTFRCPA